MATRRRYSVGRKLLIVLVVLLLLSGIAFHLFITRYLPPMVKSRLSDVIVKGSDSLYRFEVGKFDVSFWGGSIHMAGLKITIDSNRYRQMEMEKRLPSLTFNLDLPAGSVEGIGLRALIFSKRIDINSIRFASANIQLARHFRNTDTVHHQDVPLWKLIQKDIRSIAVGKVICNDLKVNYRNVDSAAAFRWEFDKCNILFSDIRVDSASTADSTRLLFAKDLALTAKEVKMKTPDGLYNLMSESVFYTSAGRSMELKGFEFKPAVSPKEFNRHFGEQHEIYTLKFPVINMQSFHLPQWIRNNKLQADTVKLASPVVSIFMDRNAKPSVKSRKGKYPSQLLQKAPFYMNIRRLSAQDASVIYTETNNLNQLTGTVTFSGLSGTIDNITNEPELVAKRSECVADIRGRIFKTGKLHSIFRFNLADRNGAFSVNATITDLNAPQLQQVFRAMTSTDIQSLNLRRMDYSATGNENAATGNLKMKYDEMDILLHRVEADKSLNKRGLLSFLANRLGIYKENPMNDEEERVATGVVVQRDATRSFFNLVWKTLFTSAGEIVLRPMAKRKIEKRKQDPPAKTGQRTRK